MDIHQWNSHALQCGSHYEDEQYNPYFSICSSEREKSPSELANLRSRRQARYSG